MPEWSIWVVAAIIFAIIEIYTPTFFIIWFSVGSIAAAITSIFTDNIIIQLAVFTVISLLLILCTKKLADKTILKQKSFKTNSDKLIGKTAKITQAIDPIEGTGRAIVSGESWKATTNDGSKIEKDETVKINKIDGVTLIVSKL